MVTVDVEEECFYFAFVEYLLKGGRGKRCYGGGKRSACGVVSNKQARKKIEK
jgi:hypothetical protein